MTKVNIYWSISTIICLIIVGLMNTVFLKPEDIGTWKNYIGYAFLIGAVLNIVYLFRYIKNRRNE